MFAVAPRPGSWRAAFGVGRSLLMTSWWRRGTRLPLPSRRWLGFRMETAYGDPHALPSRRDVLEFIAFASESRENGSRSTWRSRSAR